MTELDSDAGKVSARAQVRGSSLLLFGRMVAIVSNFAVQIMIVRHLTQDDFGSFAYSLAVVNFLVVIVSLGLDQATTRFAAMYDEDSRYEHLLGTVLTQVVVVIVMGSTVIIGVWAASDLLKGNLLDNPDAIDLLRIMVFLAPLLALDGIITNLFAVYGKHYVIFTRRYLVAPAIKVVVATALVVFSTGLKFLAWGFVLGTALSTLVYLVALIGELRRQGIFGSGKTVKPIFELGALFRFSGLVLASDLVIVMLFASDAVLVGIFENTAGVATLQAVQPFASAGQLIFMAMIPLFIPLSTRLFVRGDLPALRTHVGSATLWSIVFNGPVLFLVVGSARALTHAAFGEEYSGSAAALGFLSVGFFMQGAFGLTGLTLKVIDRQTALIVANVVVAVTNIGLNLMLIPQFGAVGAAIGTAVSLSILSVWKVALLNRAIGLNLLQRVTLTSLVWISIGTAVLLAVDLTLRPPLVFGVIASALGGMVMVRRFADDLDVDEIVPALGRSPVVRRILGLSPLAP